MIFASGFGTNTNILPKVIGGVCPEKLRCVEALEGRGISFMTEAAIAKLKHISRRCLLCRSQPEPDNSMNGYPFLNRDKT